MANFSNIRIKFVDDLGQTHRYDTNYKDAIEKFVTMSVATKSLKFAALIANMCVLGRSFSGKLVRKYPYSKKTEAYYREHAGYGKDNHKYINAWRLITPSGQEITIDPGINSIWDESAIRQVSKKEARYGRKWVVANIKSRAEFPIGKFIEEGTGRPPLLGYPRPILRRAINSAVNEFYAIK